MKTSRRAMLGIIAIASILSNAGCERISGLLSSLSSSPPAPARAAGPPAGDLILAAEDLAEMRVSGPALESFRATLAAPDATPAERRRAAVGIARVAEAEGDGPRALDAWRDLARRSPEDATFALLEALDGARRRWAWRACAELLREIEPRTDLDGAQRARVAAARAVVDAQEALRPALDLNFSEPIGDGFFVTDPLRVHWNRSRGEVDVRTGASAGGATTASPFGPAVAAAGVSWRGEPCVVSIDWKVSEIEPGSVVRVGLFGAAPEPGGGRVAMPSPARLLLEIGARADDPAWAEPLGPRRFPIALVARAGGVVARAAAQAADPGCAIDVWYRATIEVAQAANALAARIIVEERGAEGAGAAGRVVLDSTLALPEGFGAGEYVLGVVAPPDEPEGAPAAVVLRGLRLSLPPAALARPATRPRDAASGDFFRACAALACGRPAEAETAFRRAAAGAPMLDVALLGEGLTARDAGDLLGAVRALSACARALPQAADALRASISEVRARGDRLAALEAASAVLPDDPAIHAAFEEVQRATRDALDQEALLVADPGPARRLERGRLYLRVDAPASALADAEAALSASETDPQRRLPALLLRADAEVASTQPETAFVDYSRAARIDPSSLEATLGRARILLARAAEFASATPVAAPLATTATSDLTPEVGPEPQPAWQEPAQAAARFLDAAERTAGDRPEHALLRCRARLLLGDLPGARADAERAIRLAPRSAEAYSLVALVAHRQGRADDARSALARAARLGPIDPAIAREVAP